MKMVFERRKEVRVLWGKGPRERKVQRVANGRSSYDRNSQRAKEKGPLVELKSAREALVAMQK